MRTLLAFVNGFAVVFSMVWLIGHATVRIGDWEFWFAAGYLLVAALNFGHFVGRTRESAGQKGGATSQM